MSQAVITDKSAPKMEYPRIASTDLDGLWLLATLGECQVIAQPVARRLLVSSLIHTKIPALQNPVAHWCVANLPVQGVGLVVDTASSVVSTPHMTASADTAIEAACALPFFPTLNHKAPVGIIETAHPAAASHCPAVAHAPGH
jgi:hypothetical protein